MAEQHWILVGVLGAPQGVRGHLRLKSYTDDPLAIAAYGPLRAGSSTLEIVEARRIRDDMLAVRLDGIADRTAAAALTNTRLYIERGRLPQAAEEEFYHADLVGLATRNSGDAIVGRIVAVQDFGAGDLLEVEPAAGGDTFLVAFTRAFVPEVDVTGGFVRLADEALPDADPALSREPG